MVAANQVPQPPPAPPSAPPPSPPAGGDDDVPAADVPVVSWVIVISESTEDFDKADFITKLAAKLGTAESNIVVDIVGGSVELSVRVYASNEQEANTMSSRLNAMSVADVSSDLGVTLEEVKKLASVTMVAANQVPQPPPAPPSAPPPDLDEGNEDKQTIAGLETWVFAVIVAAAVTICLAIICIATAVGVCKKGKDIHKYDSYLANRPTGGAGTSTMAPAPAGKGALPTHNSLDVHVSIPQGTPQGEAGQRVSVDRHPMI